VKAWAVLEIAPPATPEQKKNKVKQGKLRDALEKIERQTGRRDPRLDAGPVPEGFGYLWNLFWNLRAGASEGFGGARITWADIEAYKRATGADLDAFEIEAVMAMDQALRDAMSEGQDGG
jgi:hypothetical protein